MLPSADGPMVDAWVALGANLGDAHAAVAKALMRLQDLPATRVVAISSLYRTAPVAASGPDFVNAVARLRTQLSPTGLLAALQALENAAGRERPYPNAPRTLDLDLLLHGDTVMQTQTLTLPHPRMLQRAFVLVPLAEISPEKVSPEALRAVAAQRIFKLEVRIGG